MKKIFALLVIQFFLISNISFADNRYSPRGQNLAVRSFFPMQGERTVYDPFNVKQSALEMIRPDEDTASTSAVSGTSSFSLSSHVTGMTGYSNASSSASTYARKQYLARTRPGGLSLGQSSWVDGRLKQVLLQDKEQNFNVSSKLFESQYSYLFKDMKETIEEDSEQEIEENFYFVFIDHPEAGFFDIRYNPRNPLQCYIGYVKNFEDKVIYERIAKTRNSEKSLTQEFDSLCKYDVCVYVPNVFVDDIESIKKGIEKITGEITEQGIIDKLLEIEVENLTKMFDEKVLILKYDKIFKIQRKFMFFSSQCKRNALFKEYRQLLYKVIEKDSKQKKEFKEIIPVLKQRNLFKRVYNAVLQGNFSTVSELLLSGLKFTEKYTDDEKQYIELLFVLLENMTSASNQIEIVKAMLILSWMRKIAIAPEDEYSFGKLFNSYLRLVKLNPQEQLPLHILKGFKQSFPEINEDLKTPDFYEKIKQDLNKYKRSFKTKDAAVIRLEKWMKQDRQFSEQGQEFADYFHAVIGKGIGSKTGLKREELIQELILKYIELREKLNSADVCNMYGFLLLLLRNEEVMRKVKNDFLNLALRPNNIDKIYAMFFNSYSTPAQDSYIDLLIGKIRPRPSLQAQETDKTDPIKENIDFWDRVLPDFTDTKQWTFPKVSEIGAKKELIEFIDKLKKRMLDKYFEIFPFDYAEEVDFNFLLKKLLNKDITARILFFNKELISLMVEYMFFEGLSQRIFYVSGDAKQEIENYLKISEYINKY
ncbi:hypothetical protein KKC59_03970, partial [bacterium]|nr:hypothetical protein [bacterium]